MHRYLLFYKPYGVLTQFTDRSDAQRPTLKDFILIPGVYPVGRLDRDSEGLLLLTSDGALQHRLTDPKFDHPKTYWAQVEGESGAEALAKLERGIALQDYRTKPARVRRLPAEPDLLPRDPPIRFRKNIPTSWIELILTEGRNRQVRRMTAAVGLPTLRLVRVAIGAMRLDGLKPGDTREIGRTEIL
jgi:23S rRNA pseudouridine2457 synthase